MSYRRHSEDSIRWRKWVATHPAAFESCGLPESVIATEERWFDLLNHGFLDHHDDPLRFHVDQLSLPQALLLYDFLLMDSDVDYNVPRSCSLFSSPAIQERLERKR